MHNAVVGLGVRGFLGVGWCCPRGDGPHMAVVICRGNPAGTLQAARNPAIAKTSVKMTLDECQSVFTQIRTDTTHDLSHRPRRYAFDRTRGVNIYILESCQPHVWSAQNTFYNRCHVFYAVMCNIMKNISPSCRGTRSQLQVIKSIIFPWGAAMRGNMSFVRTRRIGQWDDYQLGSGSYVRTCWETYDKVEEESTGRTQIVAWVALTSRHKASGLPGLSSQQGEGVQDVFIFVP